nr:trifunctional UDP-glucose 4,6-dehydratase/UDP-4-keto-6-deoxy-D-glucose 3,5-epimerase/UDP-4-keto-L-rhamnose-reductase RHM1 [Tanacetum cinerariifolium]
MINCASGCIIEYDDKHPEGSIVGFKEEDTPNFMSFYSKDQRHELIHYCLENPPYELGWNDKFILDAKGNPTTATHQVFETYQNVEQAIKDQLNAEAEAVQIILTGIDNDIYSTVDACPNACEMWKAIERLKQGSSMVQKSGIQCYNCKEYGHVARECQKLKRAKDAAYHQEKMLLSHYMYMAKLQQVFPDIDDSGPIFDKEPEQKVQNDDHYDVFAIDCQHTEKSESVHNTYLIKQDAQNVRIESEDMNFDSDQINQNDEDVDLAKERELLASLIAKLKCEIDESKNRNTLLETSNKVLVEKLKSEIADFKNKNKSLTEAN